MHFTGVSTKQSLSYIKKAKENGIPVSCSVTPYHAYFCDKDLEQYNSNLKVNPPLRDKADRKAVQKAIADGTVDCIASHHLPHEYDSKVLEFEYAKAGMISLETAFGVLNTAVTGIKPERWVELFSINPRRLFGLEPATIREGANATLTLFEPNRKWTVSEKDIQSKSRNTPFIGIELTGKAAGIINGSKIVLA
jgi:dihydroorotase